MLALKLRQVLLAYVHARSSGQPASSGAGRSSGAANATTAAACPTGTRTAGDAAAQAAADDPSRKRSLKLRLSLRLTHAVARCLRSAEAKVGCTVTAAAVVTAALLASGAVPRMLLYPLRAALLLSVSTLAVHLVVCLGPLSGRRPHHPAQLRRSRGAGCCNHVTPQCRPAAAGAGVLRHDRC